MSPRTKAKAATGPGPDPREFKWVEAALFLIDQRIQREVDPERVARIVNEFDWTRFEAVTATAKGDNYVVIEGQHRVLAVQQIDMSILVPTMVLPGTRMSTSDQAQTALDIVRGRHQHSAYEQWRQRYNAGHPHEVMAQQVLDELGLRVGKSPSATTIGAVGTIRTIVHGGNFAPEFGAQLLANTLLVLMEAFPTYDHESNVTRWNRNLLLAVADIVGRNPDVNSDRLAQKVRVRPAIQWVSMGKTDTLPAWAVIAASIRTGYNQGLRKGRLT